MLRLIIAQQQQNLRSRFPIVARDTEILPVPRKATVVIGIRRSGKSTWQHEKMESLLDGGVPARNICYIDFSDDRLDFLRLEDSEPAVITDTYYAMYPDNHARTVYFFFDELQYVNRWARLVNRIQTTESCEVYVTGSSAKLLSREIATELGGRAFSWELFPFSFREFLRAQGLPQALTDIVSRDAIIGAFGAYVELGGMPERLDLPVDSMAPGSYTATLSKDGYVTEQVTGIVVAESATVLIEPPLLRVRGGSLSGTVTLANVAAGGDHSAIVVLAERASGGTFSIATNTAGE
jgi:predicted AAA+ superfamily ATPase